MNRKVAPSNPSRIVRGLCRRLAIGRHPLDDVQPLPRPPSRPLAEPVEATDARWTRVKVFETLVRRMEEALLRREQDPASISRTRVAQAATRVAREQRAAEQLARARSVAAEVGLPIQE